MLLGVKDIVPITRKGEGSKLLLFTLAEEERQV